MDDGMLPSNLFATNSGITRDTLLEQARAVGELAWSRREESDRDRRMPDEVVEALRDSGLMKLCRRRRWGGAEADPMTFLDVGRELARGSATLGWIFNVLGIHEWYMGFTSEQLQEEVWGTDEDAFVCDSYAVVGKIDRVADGYLLSGRWRFVSGIEWSSWVAVGGYEIAPDGETPEHLMFFIRREDLKVEDDWYTVGLKGTASRSVVIERIFVPDHRVFALGRIAISRGAVVDEGPLWRVPLMTMQGMAIMTTPIGVAQRMVEEYHAWTKKRLRPYENNAASRESPAAQLALAAAGTQWDANWALAQKYAQEGWDRAIRGDSWVITDEERAKYFSWRAYVGRSCVDLSDDLYIASGAMALFDGHPMQQLFRDVHSCGVHIGIDRADAYTSRGRVAMGFPGNPNH